MFQKTGNFIQQTKEELAKVTWPSWNELWQATVVVIFATFIAAIFIAFCDFLISNLIRILIG
ncbi:MAG TPA: preprotein translocase subunit SecE [Candidatus Omnitrophota bacterium]|nr:MAG: preprotein translocase subunit SecE [Candidatus Omnitrophica bacterium ADurb.Bin314]HOE68280.1 preprotein translocase subunit SecE [Candidatus Omnitrophota bacterium]HQB93830.1 preprotein translocase subunit SecE [Candidatus Omnitrophota bacterium]